MSGIRPDISGNPNASRARTPRYATLRHSTQLKLIFQDQVDNLTVGASRFGFGTKR